MCTNEKAKQTFLPVPLGHVVKSFKDQLQDPGVQMRNIREKLATS